LNFIKLKLRKAMVHVRIYNFAPQFPEIGLDQRVMFDEHAIDHINSGDVIAYCGVQVLSKIIQGKTDISVSHLGIALKIKPSQWSTDQKRLPSPNYDIPHDPDAEMIFVVESTSNVTDKQEYFDDQIRRGVNIFSLSNRIRTIDCRGIWHFPLANPLTAEEEKKLFDYLKFQYDRRAAYDVEQMVHLGLTNQNPEDLEKFFCSELVAAGLKSTGLINCNPSMMTPRDVLELPIMKSFTPKMLSIV